MWWDSLQTVNKFNDGIKVALIVFGALTVVASVLAYVVGKRVSALQAAATQVLQGRVDSAEQAVRNAEVRRAEEERAQTLAKQREEQRRRTPPALDAYLAFGEQSQQLLVVIDAKNDIPFKYRSVIVTERNLIVSGIQLEDGEIYPVTNTKKRWSEKANIHRDKVLNEYVELRFSYESLYSAELGYPEELRGTITHKYRLLGDRVFDWPSEKSE